MKCPRCGLDMVEVIRFGITLDNCSSCGGVWLDRGELGAIIKQSGPSVSTIDDELGSRERDRREHYEKDHHGHHDRDDHNDKHRYKKRSFFDFFD